MATMKRIKSGGTQSEVPQSNSASPASSIAHSNHGSSQNINNNAPKYGTLVPNRIFVGGISSNTTEAELSQLFSKYGNVKATKIIADRAGVSKGYGFVTFESEEEVKYLVENANNVILRERRLNIAPAIKKQPFSRSFETSSPPPATPNLYYSHNGVPYTFHNGMAFFTSATAHQPAITALPASDPSIFPSFGPAQNGPPAPYGTPVLVPAPPVFVPTQNYSYQPMPMTNGAQYVYPGSGSSNSSSAGTPPDMPPGGNHMPPQPLPQFYPPHHFPAQETFYPHPVYISYGATFSTTEYETQEHQITTEESIPSTVSTPHTEMSERSSNRSPAIVAVQFPPVQNQMDPPRSNTGTPNSMQNKPPVVQATADSQVPVVSWQNLKNHAEDRQLHIRDGRRAFHPIIPPPPAQPPRLMVYEQHTYSSNSVIYHQRRQMPHDGSQNQGQNLRQRPRFNAASNSVPPFIPKFPDNFNNNNPNTTNHNFHDKKVPEVNNGRQQRVYNNKPRQGGRFRSPPPPPTTPPSSKTKPTNPSSYLSSFPSQVMQPQQMYERPMMAIPGPRWANNPAPMKRNVPYSKRFNGSNTNMGYADNMGASRSNKKPNTSPDRAEGDIGGGGDAQPISQLALTPPSTPSNSGSNQDVTSKMQTLTLGSSS